MFVHLWQQAAGEIQGLRGNIMSSGGFPWDHTDSSIMHLSLSLSTSTRSYSVISVIINQTTQHSKLPAYDNFHGTQLFNSQSYADKKN